MLEIAMRIGYPLMSIRYQHKVTAYKNLKALKLDTFIVYMNLKP